MLSYHAAQPKTRPVYLRTNGPLALPGPKLSWSTTATTVLMPLANETADGSASSRPAGHRFVRAPCRTSAGPGTVRHLRAGRAGGARGVVQRKHIRARGSAGECYRDA